MEHPTRPRPAAPAARQASLREHNLALVARAVLDAAAPPSRAAVAQATGLTRPTVSTLVDRLLRARVLDELPPEQRRTAGRPAVPLVPAARTLVGMGLEVDVDFVGARVLDLAGNVVAERIDPGQLHDAPPQETLARLGEIARRLTDDVVRAGMTLAGAQLALPGLVDVHRRRLQVAPNLGWSSLDPVPLLGLPSSLDVGVANEANLAGLAQLRPADRSTTASSFLYVSGEVGIGAAVVLDRELYLGLHGWSGEIGHLPVDPNGPRCRCGATGCLEQYAGKDAILRAAGLAPSDPLAALRDLLDDGDAPALAAVGAAGRALGRALAATINLLDLDTVLLGGIYTDLAEDLRPAVRDELDARVLATPWSPTDLRAAPVADRAALTGAAQVVLRGVVDDPARFCEA
ncbi:ROK family protein [Cellulomonas sp. PhB143]|uniref:ROK family protein n=1 Tax=Cellulomonas sp. PhB143 TaxID=2485186 RepID=UPI000F4826C5|nr:ROK family protein [Cellulomonas sp. PhB143]ROS76648.1 putative NBD/HSP70 family sugar kinase [Cellulomonas sp. PhB143]